MKIFERAAAIRPALVLAATLAISALTAGCGGGSSGGGSATIPTGSATGVTGAAGNAASQAESKTAQASLNALIAGNTTPSSTAVSAAQKLFASAVSIDKTNAQAAFGYGVTDIAVSALQLIDDTQSVTKGRHLTRAQAASIGSISGLAQQAIAWRTASLSGSTTAKSAKSLVTLPLTLTRSSSGLTSTEYNLLVADITNLNRALTRDIPYIAEAASYSGFAFPVTGIYGSTTTTDIDQGDAIAVEAALYVVRSATSIALAYNFDTGSFDFSQSLATAFAGATDGQIVVPNSYLPAAPFGNLDTNGKALFASAQSDLNTAATLVLTGIPIVEARTTSSSHLIPSQTFTQSDYVAATADVQQFQTALSGAYTLDGTTVDLNAWFTNPPASLRALEPNWHVHVYTDSAGSKVYGFATTASDFPDPTFGGLLPSASGVTLSGIAVGISLAAGQQFVTAPNGDEYTTDEGDDISALSILGDSTLGYSNVYVSFFGTGG